MWKVIVFFCPFFGQNLVEVQKHYKNRYFSTFSKAKKKNDHFEGLLSGPSKGYYLGQVCCNIKMANLAQIITLQIFAHTFFVKQRPETLFYSVFVQTVFKKTNLAQIITLQMAKLGPDNNSTANIYIYIHIFIFYISYKCIYFLGSDWAICSWPGLFFPGKNRP